MVHDHFWTVEIFYGGYVTPHFKEEEGLLPCLHQLATEPYPKPDQSNPHIKILFL
jgi:hypothetical protein